MCCFDEMSTETKSRARITERLKWLSASDTQTQRITAYLIWLLIISAGTLRLFFVLHFPPIFAEDTSVFIEIAKAPVFSAGFLAGLRPPVVPLFYKIFGINQQLIIGPQTVVAAFAWGALAWSLSKSLRTPLVRVLGVSVILAFSFTAHLILWDIYLLSESLFFSLMAMHIAAWLWFARERGRAQTVMVILTGALWALTRDTGAYVLLMLALFLLLSILVRKGWMRRRGMQSVGSNAQRAAIAAAFLFVFGLSWASASVGERWLFPFLNVLSVRVLPDDAALNFFAARGMPVSPALLRMEGKWASGEDWAFYRSPELEEFRGWTRAHAKRVYFQFLLSRPCWTLTAPLETNLDYLVSADLYDYRPAWFKAPLPEKLENILYPQIFHQTAKLEDASAKDLWKLLLWLMLVVISSVAALRAKRAEALVSLAMIALVYPTSLLIWHGDAMEILRHALKIGIGLRLATWLLIFIALDAYLKLREDRRASLKEQGKDALLS